MRVETPKSVHGCFDVVHNDGITYVLTPKTNPLTVLGATVVTHELSKVLVYKVRGFEVSINGTRVIPNQYTIPNCRLALTTLETSSAAFVPPWCSYHQAIGARFFFLYDNNSSEEEFNALVEAAKPFPGIIFRWNYPYCMDVIGFAAQAAQQTHTLCIARNHVYRVGLTDLDEYLVLLSGMLGEFLRPPIVRVQWRWFGQSGKTSLDPRDYTRSTIYPEILTLSKVFCDPLRVELAAIHHCWGPGLGETTTRDAELHHYRGLSNDANRKCDMANHETCRFCAVENLDLVKAWSKTH